MSSDSRPDGHGGPRFTLWQYLKHDLPAAAEPSWLCAVHQDPEAMQLLLRARYVCRHCTRAAAPR
ncbi:hypothetical protein [Streptomyces yaizuensis]|uniref:Uncharacterized protein n=1 Tax=Streptomyces yaizuensis TaxID=2989713 RepID=A0ABQ5NXI5_9ACTN|nr:hypothetical protein [Streptomyces sp. YSPA8]GLF94868.1 hypothetical protein SYYSPA8_11245 [Streptomyces sp. YSPA8]